MELNQELGSIAGALPEKSRAALIKVAAARMPYIIVIEHAAGGTVNIGGESFGDVLKPHELVEWKTAVKELHSTNLIERTRDCIYRVTNLGYVVAAFLERGLAAAGKDEQ